MDALVVVDELLDGKCGGGGGPAQRLRHRVAATDHRRGEERRPGRPAGLRLRRYRSALPAARPLPGLDRFVVAVRLRSGSCRRPPASRHAARTPPYPAVRSDLTRLAFARCSPSVSRRRAPGTGHAARSPVRCRASAPSAAMSLSGRYRGRAARFPPGPPSCRPPGFVPSGARPLPPVPCLAPNFGRAAWRPPGHHPPPGRRLPAHRATASLPGPGCLWAWPVRLPELAPIPPPASRPALYRPRAARWPRVRHHRPARPPPGCQDRTESATAPARAVAWRAPGLRRSAGRARPHAVRGCDPARRSGRPGRPSAVHRLDPTRRLVSLALGRCPIRLARRPSSGPRCRSASAIPYNGTAAREHAVVDRGRPVSGSGSPGVRRGLR